MVEGIDSFRDKFRDYTDCYTVIGGAACDILMSEAEIAFRATKDIDMILILQDKKAEFVKAFWVYPGWRIPVRVEQLGLRDCFILISDQSKQFSTRRY